MKYFKITVQEAPEIWNDIELEGDGHKGFSCIFLGPLDCMIVIDGIVTGIVGLDCEVIELTLSQAKSNGWKP